MNDPEFGSELRRRASPKFAAQQRRAAFWALNLGVIMGLVCLADALHARTHGGMVSGGPYNHSGISLPWWMVAPMGLFIVAISVWGHWRFAIKRD
jgi:hypothetical protein